MLCGHFPSVEGFGGCSLHQLGGFGGHQHLNVHMLILVYIFVGALCIMFLLWL